MYIVYIIYSILILIFIIILKYDTLKRFKIRAINVLSKPKVILNLSYGIVINGVFGILNAKSIGIVGFYLILTGFGFLGIINTSEKDWNGNFRNNQIGFLCFFCDRSILSFYKSEA